MIDVDRFFEADELRPAQNTVQPAVGDMVDIWLTDGPGFRGHVRELLGDGWIKVEVDGAGRYAVAPGRATVVSRAH